MAATAKPNELTGKGVVAARQAESAITPYATKPTTGSKALEKEE
jgi:hypothetical protein